MSAEDLDNKLAHESEEAGYEKSDVSVPWITTIALIVIGVIVVFVIILNEYFLVTKETMVEETVLSKPSAALRELHAREDQELGSYKLLDAETGIYQIPIERAMELQAEEAYERQLEDR